MSTNYDPYEKSAINAVRKDKLRSVVDEKSFDNGKDPLFNPRLILLNPQKIEKESLQQRHTENTGNYCRNLSITGGSKNNLPYNNSYDARQNTG